MSSTSILTNSGRQYLPLTDEQIRLVMRLDPSDNRNAVIQFMLFTGLRISECLGLTWNNVASDKTNILIKQQLLCMSVPGGNRYSIRTSTKNLQYRKILIPAQASDLLTFLEQTRATQKTPDKAFIFISPRHEPWKPEQIRRHFYRLMDDAGLPRKRLHDLRHTTADAAYKASNNLEAVRRLLGHEDIRITADVYCPCVPGAQRAVSDAISEYINNTVNTNDPGGFTC